MRLLMSSIILLFSITSFAALPTQLEWKKSKVIAAIKWESGPIVGGNSSALIDFSSTRNQKPIEPPGGIDVVIHKVGQAETFQATVTKITDKEGKNFIGKYQVSDLKFTEPGDWQMDITLKYPNQKNDTEFVRIKVLEK
ncbi:hypothetical protein D3C87_1212160 [compost metagenome]